MYRSACCWSLQRAAAATVLAPLSAARLATTYKTQRVAPVVAPGAPSTFSLRPPTRSSCAEDSGPIEKKPLSALQKRQLAMKDKKAFALTPLAMHRIKLLLSGHNASATASNRANGIRVGVKRRGCSGYSYTINYALERDPQIKPDDTHVEQGGVHVYVDHTALFFVIGTEMDFVTSNVEEKFTFKNPNQKHGCGCGESFMPYDV
jgi:iron-sulfur cluster assembly accessory protein